MTNEPSPRPWHLEGKCIYTAHGDFIGEMEHADDARLVVDAVNHMDYDLSIRMELNDARAEIDRLRDIVKVLIPVAEMTLAYQEAMKKAGSDQIDGIEAARNEIRKILAEARAAIGGGAP